MFKNDLLNAARKAASADELADLAKKNGITLSPAEAADLFAKFRFNSEIAEDELDSVVGGCFGDTYEEPGDVSRRPERVDISSADPVCAVCGSELVLDKLEHLADAGGRYDLYICTGSCSFSVEFGGPDPRYRHYFKGDVWTKNV